MDFYPAEDFLDGIAILQAAAETREDDVDFLISAATDKDMILRLFADFIVAFWDPEEALQVAAAKLSPSERAAGYRRYAMHQLTGNHDG